MPPLRPSVKNKVQKFKPRLITQNNMSIDEQAEYIQNMPDEVLSRIQFSVPWQYDDNDGGYKDADGFTTRISPRNKEDSKPTRDVLQMEMWDKFNQNPQINTSVRGTVGRMTGMDFGVTSGVWDIQEVLEEVELDPRNRLYNFWPKFVGRYLVEGELFLILSLHPDGFVEVDMLDPVFLSGRGDQDSGIIFHPDKPTMPLYYIVTNDSGTVSEMIPSVFIARYPDLRQTVEKHNDFKAFSNLIKKSRKHVYRRFKGAYRFVVGMDRGFVVRRAIGHLRTVIQWINHYENLKKYEIDHKKSAGAYLWTFKIENPRDFKLWLTLTDEERRKTGIMAKKTPGSTLVLPPGMTVEAVGPKLPSIKDEDTDILSMVGSGLNEPEDIMTGASKGTFASVKESRGPMSDRISDEIAYFQRFLQYDFWGSIFFLRSAIGKMAETFKRRVAVEWNKQEPVYKNIKRLPQMLLDFSFPSSETIDFADRAKALLGVKHGPISETLGIPFSDVAAKLGFGNYERIRLRKAEEDDTYPELVYTADAESLQEQTEAEPAKKQPAKKQPSSNNKE